MIHINILPNVEGRGPIAIPADGECSIELRLALLKEEYGKGHLADDEGFTVLQYPLESLKAGHYEYILQSKHAWAVSEGKVLSRLMLAEIIQCM